MVLTGLVALPGYSQSGNKILFDATKAEMASNADWVVDADLHNVGTGSGGAMQAGRGSESNPQRLPTPAESTFTAATTETVWNGAISAWGLACARQNLVVETLPIGAAITYQDGSNAQDLSNYKVYVVVEPNIRFAAAEKDAIIRWVEAGGGLFIISDHNNSDRNGDGIDSPAVLNDLISANTVHPNPFGFSYELTYFSETSGNVAAAAGSAILNGPLGRPRNLQISGGASISLDTAANRTARALWWRNGYARTSPTAILVAQASFGLGRVVGMTDSSPMDDGTGDTGDQLYTGWAEQNGDHAKLITNATLWLAGRTNDTVQTTAVVPQISATSKLGFYPNPSRGAFEIIAPEVVAAYRIDNLLGQALLEGSVPEGKSAIVDGGLFPAGVYIVKATGRSGRVYVGRVTIR